MGPDSGGFAVKKIDWSKLGGMVGNKLTLAIVLGVLALIGVKVGPSIIQKLVATWTATYSLFTVFLASGVFVLAQVWAGQKLAAIAAANKAVQSAEGALKGARDDDDVASLENNVCQAREAAAKSQALKGVVEFLLVPQWMSRVTLATGVACVVANAAIELGGANAGTCLWWMDFWCAVGVGLCAQASLMYHHLIKRRGQKADRARGDWAVYTLVFGLALCIGASILPKWFPGHWDDANQKIQSFESSTGLNDTVATPDQVPDKAEAEPGDKSGEQPAADEGAEGGESAPVPTPEDKPVMPIGLSVLLTLIVLLSVIAVLGAKSSANKAKGERDQQQERAEAAEAVVRDYEAAEAQRVANLAWPPTPDDDDEPAADDGELADF